MGEQNKPVETNTQGQSPRKDSFNQPVQKSPWLIYALLQIPIVIIMIIIVYFMYQAKEGG